MRTVRTVERVCNTYMRPMKVPISNAPNVLSREGMWGSAAKGSAGIPVGEEAAAEREEVVAMAEGGSQHSALVCGEFTKKRAIYYIACTRPIRSFGGTGRPLEPGRPRRSGTRRDGRPKATIPMSMLKAMKMNRSDGRQTA